MYEHDENIFGLSKVFQKPWNRFRVLSSVSMKYSPWEKGKCYWYIYSLHYRNSKRDMTALDRFLNKEKWHSQVIGMFATFRENWLSPERQMPSHSSFMLLLKKRLSYPYRYKTQLNFVLYLHSVLFINVTITD